MVRPPGLLYSVDETPPRAVFIVAGLQHVALISNSLLYPIILGREARLSPEQLLDFVSLSMLSLGMATLLLCAKNRFVGSGYLCPAGFTQIYLGPSLSAVHIGGLPLVFGMTAIAGALQIAIAPALRRVRFLFPPEIAGLVIAVVGLSIAVLGVRYGMGSAPNAGMTSQYLVIFAASLTTMVILNVWTRGYLRMFCLLLGAAVGYAVSAALGLVDFSAAMPSKGLSLLRVPSLGFMHWRFDASLIAPFAVVGIAGILNLVATVPYAQRINDADWVRPSFTSLKGGLVGNGIATVVAAVIGSMGNIVYSPCIGLSAATGIASRSVAYMIAFALALLALIPAAAAVITTIPAPVVGASLFFTAAFVFTSGLQAITARLLDSRKIIVIGFSFAMAMIANTSQDLLVQAPVLLRPILDNGLMLGTASAVLLNLIMRIGVRQRVTMKLDAGHVNRDTIELFLTEQGGRWGARRDIISRAIFGVVQLLEVVGDVPAGTEVEASFDEFNLDVRVRYKGAPLIVPERKPTPREIVASEDGERLLAGYLLRQSADRINCKVSGTMAEVQLHYDH
jgi:xanthine permease XanP